MSIASIAAQGLWAQGSWDPGCGWTWRRIQIGVQSPSWGEKRETQGGSNCNWARVSGAALLTHKSLLGSPLPTSESSDVRLGAHLLEISLDESQPRWLKGKEFACRPGDPGSIPGWGRSPGEGNGNPLQSSCLENPMNWGAWWAMVSGVAKSHDLTTKQQQQQQRVLTRQ